MTHPRCRTCGEPVGPTDARYAPASSPDGSVAEHWDCHEAGLDPLDRLEFPELMDKLREEMSLHLGPDAVHGDSLPRRD